MKKITIFCILILLFTINLESQENDQILYINYDWQPYTINVDGTNSKQFMDYFGLSQLDWSPKGGGFVATVGHQQIYYFDAQTKEATQLTDFEQGDNFHPKWSPDGEKIAFVSNRDASKQIYVMNANGTNQTRVTPDNLSGGGDGLTWVLDNNHILFTHNVGYPQFDENTQSYEDGYLYVLDINDGTIYQIVHTTEDCTVGKLYTSPAWSMASKQLIFAMGCGSSAASNLYLVQATSLDDLLAFEYQDLTINDSVLSYTYYQGISWSPSGNKVAFITYFRSRDTKDIRGEEIAILDIAETLSNEEPSYVEITNTLTDEYYDYHYRGLTWIIP